MRRRVKERYAQIETEARVLARSANYRSAAAIEIVLLARGYREAAELFANRWTQSELDRLCDAAIRGRDSKLAA